MKTETFLFVYGTLRRGQPHADRMSEADALALIRARESPSSLVAFGYDYYTNGMYDHAIQYFQQYLDTKDDKYRAEAKLYLVELNYKRFNYGDFKIN